MPEAVTAPVFIGFASAVLAVTLGFGFIFITRFFDISRGFSEINHSITQGFSEINHSITQGFAEVNRNLAQGFSEVNHHLDQGFAEVNRNLAQGFSELNHHLDQGFAEVNHNLAQGFSEVNHNTSQGFSQVNSTLLRIDQRLTNIERPLSLFQAWLMGRDLEQFLRESGGSNPDNSLPLEKAQRRDELIKQARISGITNREAEELKALLQEDARQDLIHGTIPPLTFLALRAFIGPLIDSLPRKPEESEQ